MGSALTAVNLNGQVAKQLSIGQQFSCVILADNTIRCWGVNERGQLGNGTFTNAGSLQADMGATQKVVVVGNASEGTPLSIATGAEHGCAADKITVETKYRTTKNPRAKDVPISNTQIPKTPPVGPPPFRSLLIGH